MPEQQQGPVRLGVKMHPPTILVEYYVKDPTQYAPQPQASKNQEEDNFSRNTSASKLRRKTVRLHNLDSSKDSAQDVASAVSRNFPIHFGRGVVNHTQLVSLIAKLQGSLSSTGVKDGSQSSIEEDSIVDKDNIIDKDTTIDKDIIFDKDNIVDKDNIIDKDSLVIDYDNNTVGDDSFPSETTKQPREQHRHGGDMVSETVRVKNLLPALIATVLGGDQQKGKEGSEDSAAEVKSSLGDPSERREEMGDSLICGGGVSLQSKTDTAAAATVAPRATSVDMLDGDGDGEDLNRISEAELAAAKSRMDVMFQRNQLLPGEQGYTHDVRRNFSEPQEDCDWDSN